MKVWAVKSCAPLPCAVYTGCTGPARGAWFFVLSSIRVWFSNSRGLSLMLHLQSFCSKIAVQYQNDNDPLEEAIDGIENYSIVWIVPRVADIRLHWTKSIKRSDHQFAKWAIVRVLKCFTFSANLGKPGTSPKESRYNIYANDYKLKPTISHSQRRSGSLRKVSSFAVFIFYYILRRTTTMQKRKIRSI